MLFLMIEAPLHIVLLSEYGVFIELYPPAGGRRGAEDRLVSDRTLPAVNPKP